ncbi:unnamed protein product [Parajaminaea phylloscopi]
MPSKKKQRTSTEDAELSSRGILGTASATAGLQPTPEEMQLTASLFGAGPSTSTKAPYGGESTFGGASVTGMQSMMPGDEDTGLEDLADDQLFAFDGADDPEGDEAETEISSTSSDASDSEGPSSEEESEEAPQPGPSRSTAAGAQKSAVWTDPSTSSLLVALVGPNARAVDGSLAGTKRLRKLRVNKDEREISGREYELRLRQQYEKLHPRPEWASRVAATSQVGATEEAASSTAAQTSQKPSIHTASKDVSLSQLLSRDSGLVSRVTGTAKARKPLSSGTIEIERLRDVHAGLDDPELASAIECMEFHPATRASSRLLMTASRDRRVRLYNVDGAANALLQTVHVPSLPITTAAFHPNGTSLLLSGPRPFLYSYDLQAGRITRSSPWRGSASGGGISEEDSKERDLSMSKFQPLDSAGASRLLAIGGRRGGVHLIDWARSGGASGGSLVASLRQNSPLAGLEWDASPEADGRRLISLGQDGTMNIWDVRNMSCSVVKRDVGLFGARGVAASRGGRHWAVGSDSGIVNMYRGQDLQARGSGEVAATKAGQATEEAVEAVKSISNLVTGTTTLRFNYATAAGGGDSEIMAVASRIKKDALRLVHTGSLTVFSNWPTSGTPLGHVSDVAFDPSGRYLAVGNTRGRTLLYSLPHFKA